MTTLRSLLKGFARAMRNRWFPRSQWPSHDEDDEHDDYDAVTAHDDDDEKWQAGAVASMRSQASCFPASRSDPKHSITRVRRWRQSACRSTLIFSLHPISLHLMCTPSVELTTALSAQSILDADDDNEMPNERPDGNTEMSEVGHRLILPALVPHRCRVSVTGILRTPPGIRQ